jgi:hypothetical protein
MWASVERKERGRAPRSLVRRVILGSMVAASLSLVVVAAILRWRAPATDSRWMAGVVIDTGGAAQTVSLPDGSSLDLRPATRLRIVGADPGEIRLRVERGALLCDVTHREGRRFVVEVASTEVEVKGTRFEVEVQEAAEGVPSVRVSVERGAVEVRDPARAPLAMLHAGETWASRAAAPEVPASSAPAPAPPPVLPSAAPSASSPPGALLESPRVLFERAAAARLAGHHEDAAAQLDRLVRRFPNDARAGLAAYQLGRVRLGSLHEPGRAVDAFTFALEHAPDDMFREDAEAGRIEAAEELGDLVRCRRWRKAFLAQHPTSPQTARVMRSCGAP